MWAADMLDNKAVVMPIALSGNDESLPFLVSASKNQNLCHMCGDNGSVCDSV